VLRSMLHASCDMRAAKCASIHARPCASGSPTTHITTPEAVRQTWRK
jgi:hypothetical protein